MRLGAASWGHCPDWVSRGRSAQLAVQDDGLSTKGDKQALEGGPHAGALGQQEWPCFCSIYLLSGPNYCKTVGSTFRIPVQHGLITLGMKLPSLYPLVRVGGSKLMLTPVYKA